jgi:hypothetical protein
MTPIECLRAYNRMTGRIGAVLPESRGNLAEAERFLAWCAHKRVTPKHWIAARHEANGWAYQISLTDLTDADAEFRERWDAWGADRMAQMDQERSDRAKVVEDTDRRKSTTILGEAMKAAYADEPATCMLIGQPLTGGWNPDSAWCRDCELSLACKQTKTRTRGRDARG